MGAAWSNSKALFCIAYLVAWSFFQYQTNSGLKEDDGRVPESHDVPNDDGSVTGFNVHIHVRPLGQPNSFFYPVDVRQCLLPSAQHLWNGLSSSNSSSSSPPSAQR